VRRIRGFERQVMLEVIEEQAEQGVDYMTIHAGVLREFCLWCATHHRNREPRGRNLAQWMSFHKHRQNFLYENFDAICKIFAEARCEFFAGRRIASRMHCRCQR
jgi:phosphomethylpyrimidine synthase